MTPPPPLPPPPLDVSFANPGMRRIERHHHDGLRPAIAAALRRQLAEGRMAKVKPATRLRHDGHTVYELRVNTPEVNLRVAFTHHPGTPGSPPTAHVLYASTTLTKADFTRELDRHLRG